jgi:hypothetical protein
MFAARAHQRLLGINRYKTAVKDIRAGFESPTDQLRRATHALRGHRVWVVVMEVTRKSRNGRVEVDMHREIFVKGDTKKLAEREARQVVEHDSGTVDRVVEIARL